MVLRFLLLAAVFFLSCTEVQRDNPYDSGGINFRGEELPSSSSTPSDSGTLTDSRDGRVYRTVKIGNQVWMAENLDYVTSNSKCCDSSSTEQKCPYGRLYYSGTAIYEDICPKGWILPDSYDWNKLINTAGGHGMAGWYLKATSGWNNDGNGVDEFGFAAMPGGYYNDKGCQDVGFKGFWHSGRDGYVELSYFEDEVNGEGGWIGKKESLSVRCIKD
ncbi:MAG: hypothetical protein LBC75_09895 [Fibromonadaceae bacterium]|jgi:uncharacterized protein (TIGR02145 family)|nr:hypothetical protein [Fibromonadaceae bacterium]